MLLLHFFSSLTSSLSYEYTTSSLCTYWYALRYVQFGAIVNKAANEDFLLEICVWEGCTYAVVYFEKIPTSA